MKKTLGALLAAALMTVSANAAVTVTGSIQTAANGGFATSAQAISGTTLFDFNNGALLGTVGNFTLSNNNVNLGNATVLATHVQNVAGNTTNSSAPADDNTNYLAVLTGGYQSIANSLASFNTLALYWGTPDSYNTIDLLDQGGNSIATIGAGDVAGLSALGASSALVTLTSSQNFYGAKFSSGGNAFELDNVRFSNAAQAPAGTGTSAVPEPASWAMMIVGFGAVGYASRRRSSRAKAFAL